MNGKRLEWMVAGLVLLALLAVVLAGCGGPSPALVATQTARAEEKAMVDVLSPVCEGGTVSQAAEYRQTSGLHSLIVLRGQPGVSWRLDDDISLPEWGPQTLAGAELVACVQHDAILIETCPYTLENNKAASVERYQYVTHVALYAATTGALLAENDWTGSEPDQCTDKTRFAENEPLKKVYGLAAGGREIQPWLQTYVELP